MKSVGSGLQPSDILRARTWGFTPGCVGARRWRSRAAVGAVGVMMVFSGCKSSTPVPVARAVTQPSGPVYPARSTDIPPAFKVFHQDEDTYTLVIDKDATDDEVAALLWEFRDAAKAHGFQALKLSEAFIDARKPSIWFHVYRGTKCANEKFVKGKYPCGAKYNGAGDFTLGAYGNPGWNDGVLHLADGTEKHLWDSEAR